MLCNKQSKKKNLGGSHTSHWFSRIDRTGSAVVLSAASLQVQVCNMCVLCILSPQAKQDWFFLQWCQKSRRQVDKQDLLRPKLSIGTSSLLLTCLEPKKVPWPSSNSRTGEGQPTHNEITVKVWMQRGWKNWRRSFRLPHTRCQQEEMGWNNFGVMPEGINPNKRYLFCSYCPFKNFY